MISVDSIKLKRKMHNRFNYILLLVATLAMFNCQWAMAQEEVAVDALNDGTPVILYSGEPKKIYNC
jgi:hypothetical protein